VAASRVGGFSLAVVGILARHLWTKVGNTASEGSAWKYAGVMA
jgi:hypothetical protein